MHQYACCAVDGWWQVQCAVCTLEPTYGASRWLDLQMPAIHEDVHLAVLRGLPCPAVIPCFSCRSLGLYPCILDRYTLPDAVVLQHGYSVQSSFFPLRRIVEHAQLLSFFGCHAVLVYQPKSLAGSPHAVVLPFELQFTLVTKLVLVL